MNGEILGFMLNAVDTIMTERLEKLHPTQKLILYHFRALNSVPFTVREWQQILNLSSPSVAYHHLQHLVKKGFLRKVDKGYYRN